MGIVDDVLKALDRIPTWKRLGAVPDEVADLKRRVGELEEKLAGKWPAEVCRYCGERAVRLYWTSPANDKGIIQEEWLCSSCQQIDKRPYKAATR